MAVPGGHSAEKEATAEIQEIANQVKSEVESKAGKTLSTYEVTKYTQQVVAGMNYTLKIKGGDGDSDYLHVKVHRALPHEGGAVSVKEVQTGKTAGDAL